jgi:multiple sugar transport system ATP-binding protein
MVEAMTLADKIVVLRAGEVMQIGAPMDLYHNPANLFVAGFLGSPAMNFLDVTVQGRDDGGLTVSNATLDAVRVPSALTAAVGDKLVLGVRPQYLTISLDPAAGRLHGTVVLTERLGSDTIVNLAMKDGGTIIAALGEDALFEPGREVSLTFDPQKAHLFWPEERSRAAH